MNPEIEKLPKFSELPVKPGAPADSTWGVWGDHDQLGTVNMLTPDGVVAAATLVRRGAVFRLDTAINYAQPPLFGRDPAVHTIEEKAGFFAHDDILDNYNTQQGSQWDGLGHVGYPPLEAFYNGYPRSDIHSGIDGKLGVHLWKDKIVGRGVLIDVAKYLEEQGRPLAPDSLSEISVDDLEAARKSQGVEFKGGDILLVRTGWLEWYEALPQSRRDGMSTNDTITAFGLDHGRETARWLWDNHISLIGLDNPAVETFPWADMYSEALHHRTLALLGLPLGEQFVLADLAADCASDGVYEFMLVSVPLVLTGGVATPPNAVAIK